MEKVGVWEMNVFVFTDVWQCDSGECGSTTKVFSTFEKAQRCLEEAMETAKQDFSGLETEETEYVKGDMAYSIWEAGEYCYNHIDLTIQELEIE